MQLQDGKAQRGNLHHQRVIRIGHQGYRHRPSQLQHQRRRCLRCCIARALTHKVEADPVRPFPGRERHHIRIPDPADLHLRHQSPLRQTIAAVHSPAAVKHRRKNRAQDMTPITSGNLVPNSEWVGRARKACQPKIAFWGGLACCPLRGLAERQGFEPWRRCRLHTFQACAFDHSATSPFRPESWKRAR